MYDPMYLDFFENIIYGNKEIIQKNIGKIINQILDSNKKISFLYMKENSYYKVLMKNSGEIENKLQNLKLSKYHLFGNYIFDLNVKKCNLNDFPYIFHAKAINIITVCLKNQKNNKFMKFICQNTFNINYLI